MADREQPVTLRTRKFIRNSLLGRKQMVVYVLSPRSSTSALHRKVEIARLLI